jgi:hypothetical protein
MDGTVGVLGLVRGVVIVEGLRVGVRMRLARAGAEAVLDLARAFDPTAGKANVYLDGSDTRPTYATDGDLHSPKAQSRRQALEPRLGCPSRNQGSKEHVAADSGGGVEDGKTAL